MRLISAAVIAAVLISTALFSETADSPARPVNTQKAAINGAKNHGNTDWRGYPMDQYCISLGYGLQQNMDVLILDFMTRSLALSKNPPIGMNFIAGIALGDGSFLTAVNSPVTRVYTPIFRVGLGFHRPLVREFIKFYVDLAYGLAFSIDPLISSKSTMSGFIGDVGFEFFTADFIADSVNIGLFLQLSLFGYNQTFDRVVGSPKPLNGNAVLLGIRGYI